MNNIKRFFLKYRLNIASGLTIILTLIAALSIYFSIEVRVTSNDECLWNQKTLADDSAIIYFSKFKENGVAWNAGIRNGDQLYKLMRYRLKIICRPRKY